MTKVIAEIGINHNGDYEIAKNLIDQAAQAKCWGIKFQFRDINSFYSNSDELGDEMISREISKNHLTPDQINLLCDYAKELGLQTGISFFRVQDAETYGSLQSFDFLKVPSAECTNVPLIEYFLSKSNNVLISVGGHTEKDIVKYLMPFKDQITVMHCVSNYPVRLGWQNLSYISRLKELGFSSVGYSSHDDEIEVCLMALTYKPVYIERHLTYDKNGQGLDHSTSSVLQDFEKLQRYVNSIDGILYQDKNTPNQGEILNIQNLGTGLYAKHDIPAGVTPKLSDFNICAPSKGLTKNQFTDKPLINKVSKGESLNHTHYDQPQTLTKKSIEYAVTNQIGIPVRYHDYAKISNLIPLEIYEFHMSPNDVYIEHNKLVSLIDSRHKFSIHLPDYLHNSVDLIDPLSDDVSIRDVSKEIINKTCELSIRIQDKVGHSVPIVGSFPVLGKHSKNTTMDYLFEFISTLDNKVFPQWLPRWGWYFGGAYEIPMFNDLDDINYIRKNNSEICLDVCHLILSSNYHKLDWRECFTLMQDNIAHLHIADAIGIDGEGVKMGSGSINREDLEAMMNQNCFKILEVWQGHLNNGQGFISDLEYIASCKQ